MAKIPTFEATVAPTAEVGAVKSNIQVSPKSSLAGALLPAADAITQFYVKEKEISNKVEGGQLIADANQELLEIKEKAKLKATPDEGVNFFNAGYKQVVDKYKSKASNNYIQRYFDLNIASNKPSYVNNILSQTRANMVKTRVDQVSREVSNEITTAVENKNTFNFAILAESITSKYQGLVNDGLISEADLEIYKRQLPALVETEMVRKIANEDAFAALVSLDDPKNYSSITGDDRLKLKKELRELSTFQKNIVEYTTNSEGLKYKKKVSEALQGNQSTAILGIKPDEISLYYSTGNPEFDNQIIELNNKVINNKISKDNNYLVNDKIIKKILNNEIKHPFEGFVLPGETEAKSITERVGDGSINLDDDNFFNNIFENQQNSKLIEANKQFFNFIDKVIPLIEGSVSSKYFDENYNNRLSSFRQDMHSKFIDGVKNNIPVAQLLDSTSDNYIAKDILDYTPTKSTVRDALLNTAKKETVVENTFFKKRVDETPSQYLDRIQEHYVKEDGSFDKRQIKKMTREDVMKGSILDGGTFQDTDNEFNFMESIKEGIDKISNFFISKADAAEMNLTSSKRIILNNNIGNIYDEESQNNLEKFITAVHAVESNSGDSKYLLNKASSATGHFQFKTKDNIDKDTGEFKLDEEGGRLQSSFETALKRLEAQYLANDIDIPDWVKKAKKTKNPTEFILEELTYDQQVELFLMNIQEQKGSKALIKGMLDGDIEKAKQLYIDFHYKGDKKQKQKVLKNEKFIEKFNEVYNN